MDFTSRLRSQAAALGKTIVLPEIEDDRTLQAADLSALGVVAPLDGEVLEVNGDVVDSPEQVNDDPYAAWLIKVRICDPSSADALLVAAAYQALL